MPRVLLAFEPPDGGVAENVLQLAAGLPEHGWDVQLAGPAEGAVYGRIPPGGRAPVRLPFARGYGHPGADARALRQLVGLLRHGRYDVLHCHSAKAGVLGRIAARAVGVPVVYSPHCFPFIGEFGTARRQFATLVERTLGPATDAVICVCEDERRQGERAGLDPKRLHVVLNGCAAPGEAAPDPVLEAMRREGPLAATVAVLRRQKRIDVFLDAVPHVWARVPEARLAVVGTGPLRDELDAQAGRLGLPEDPRFAFVDFTPPPERALRALDAYVLSSSWEGLPIGVLEALSCGIPQVATSVGGTGEAVGSDTGRLVPPGDPAALGAAIAGVLADPAARAAMAEASVARWRSRFRLERMVAETAATYERVLHPARP